MAKESLKFSKAVGTDDIIITTKHGGQLIIQGDDDDIMLSIIGSGKKYLAHIFTGEIKEIYENVSLLIRRGGKFYARLTNKAGNIEIWEYNPDTSTWSNAGGDIKDI